MSTIRLTAAQALVRWLGAQLTEDGLPFIAGVWAIFGHGSVAGLGEALYEVRDTLPTYRGHNEQSMAHAAIAYSKQLNRKRAMAVSSSIGPGATNMVTAAALAHVNRLPVLFLPADVFANRRADPVLQQIEDFTDGTISANDCFKPVSCYFDRIMRPEQLLTALPRAMAIMNDPANAGPVTLALCQDVQAEAYDWPLEFFNARTWQQRRTQPDTDELSRVADALRSAKKPVIVAGGGVHYSDATATLATFAETHNIPVVETQAGKSALPWQACHELWPGRRHRRHLCEHDLCRRGPRAGCGHTLSGFHNGQPNSIQQSAAPFDIAQCRRLRCDETRRHPLAVRCPGGP